MMEKPVILAVETSGRTGSVAIAEGANILAETAFSRQLRHSAEIFPASQELLERFGKRANEIEQIYVSVGPGSFTGLRISVTMAKTMSLASGSKIVAVDTLDAIATNASDYMKLKNVDIEQIGVILDAKRGQFFVAVYENKDGKWEKILADCLMSSSEFVEKFGHNKQRIKLLGEGLVYYKKDFECDGIEFLDEKYWWPSARKVHLLGWEKAQRGQFEDALNLQPLYLRLPELGKKRKS